MGSQATRNSAHSGRQRRPHKGLYGFCNPVTKPQFRGCSNFNLADLGVANFTANLAGYSAMYVVLCCTAKSPVKQRDISLIYTGGKVDHPFGVVPASADPAPDKIVIAFCNPGVGQFVGMAGNHCTCSCILIT